jgi:RHS repeat-associated protein
VAPDSTADSTLYDPSGNIVSAVTRRSDPTTGTRLAITMTYDVMDRLVARALPQLTYLTRPTGFHDTQPWTSDTVSYPAYNIPSETHQFTYDDAGRLLTADNPDAKIRRTYYPNGMLDTDVLKIQTYARDDTTKHVYSIKHTYDLDGRQTKLGIPYQLRAGSDSIAYAYEAETGLLQTLTDLQGSQYTYGYDFMGQLTSLTYPGQYLQARYYDVDGRLVLDSIRNLSTAGFPRMPNPVRSSAFRWDARNKLLLGGDGVRYRDTVTAGFSGIGNLTTSKWKQYGCTDCDLDPSTVHVVTEAYTVDALGNKTQTALGDTLITNGQKSSLRECCETLAYQAKTGRLLTITPAAGGGQVTYSYDAAGNQVFASAINPNLTSSEVASFYAADGKLRMVQTRWGQNEHPVQLQNQKYAIEDYRYDALGRRVWVRAQKHCEGFTTDIAQRTECRTGLIRRTVWDGDMELAEIQMPWTLQGSSTGGSYKIDSLSTWWENDTLPTMLGSRPWGDPDPLFGRVVYAGRSGIDQPVAVTRANYVWLIDWYSRSVGSTETVEAPVTIVPFWTATGDAHEGVVSSGALTRCANNSTRTGCVGIQWPWDKSSWDRQGVGNRATWHGTLLEGKRDKSGFSYMRNRYYDPRSGRFTQEDPIGLAGGLNAYGYAEGDPVNFSDPFGLCPWTGDIRDRDLTNCPLDHGKEDVRTSAFRLLMADSGPEGGETVDYVVSHKVDVRLHSGLIQCGNGTAEACSLGNWMSLNRKRSASTVAADAVHEMTHLAAATDHNGQRQEAIAWSRGLNFYDRLPISLRTATDYNRSSAYRSQYPVRFFNLVCTGSVSRVCPP